MIPPMPPTRRDVLAAGLAAVAAPSLARASAREASPLGLVIHSFPVRVAATRDRPPAERFAEPRRFLEYAKGLGARGVQVGIGAPDDAEAERLREAAASAGMTLEGIVTCPKDESDAARFEAEVRAASRAGATILRTAMLSGRRYEAFDSLDAYRDFARRSGASLALALPIAARHGARLAVENHKDWRLGEMVALLERFAPEGLGVCLDTGNSMALLEDPMEVVEALARWTITTHFKDMGVEAWERGFRLAEVPLGEGVLDLPRVVRALRSANPSVPLNLEMITRDPLDVPCLADRYWATMPDLPARQLARALAFVRDHPPRRPLPRASGLEAGARLRAEDENIRICLSYSRDRFSSDSI
jgi:sugar phosphate isomerase/epimerase